MVVQVLDVLPLLNRVSTCICACVVQDTMKALKRYLQKVHQAHPMAAIFVLGTHRELAHKRAVEPPDTLIKVCLWHCAHLCAF